jgi:hypothetical protein
MFSVLVNVNESKLNEKKISRSLPEYSYLQNMKNKLGTIESKKNEKNYRYGLFYED